MRKKYSFVAPFFCICFLVVASWVVVQINMWSDRVIAAEYKNDGE